MTIAMEPNPTSNINNNNQSSAADLAALAAATASAASNSPTSGGYEHQRSSYDWANYHNGYGSSMDQTQADLKNEAYLNEAYFGKAGNQHTMASSYFSQLAATHQQHLNNNNYHNSSSTAAGQGRAN